MTSSAGTGLHRHDITQRNLDGYGAPTIDWARVKDVLDGQLTQAPDTGGPQRHTVWLTTINPDGSPHVTPLGVVQLNGVWYFSSGPATRKSRNLDRDPRCVVSVATHPFDLVIEGAAERVADGGELASVAEAFANKVGPPRSPATRSQPSSARRRPARRPGMSTASGRRRCSRSARRNRSAPRGST